MKAYLVWIQLCLEFVLRPFDFNSLRTDLFFQLLDLFLQWRSFRLLQGKNIGVD